MSWAGAMARGLLIVAYFVITTVWLPDQVASIGAIQAAPRLARDLVISGVWGVSLGGGLWALRAAQARRLI